MSLDLHQLVGEDRLRGVSDWSDVERLGRRNTERALRFARALADRELSDSTREERRERATLLQRLDTLTQESSLIRPVLPRLRVECFRVGQEVVVLLADTPGAQGPHWASGTVEAVEKSHRVAWSHHASRGYYWRVTAHLEDGSRLAFTTSEPRVLQRTELEELRQAASDDPRFVEIFCENARRPWHPLWCLEAGTQSRGEELDLALWLPLAPADGRNHQPDDRA